MEDPKVHDDGRALPRVGARSDEVHFWVEFSITPGEEDRFRTALHGAIERLDREDPSTSSFQCYISADGTTCHIQERYRDSRALLVHLAYGAQARLLTTVLAVSRMSRMEIHGNLTPEAAIAVAPYRPTLYGHFGGFTRPDDDDDE